MASDRPAPTPSLSVVLCTYNRADLLVDALQALVDQSADSPPYEVVVVDNNSTDRTREVVESFVPRGIVRYTFEPRQGLSSARNHGTSVARSELVAFTDDDVRVTPTWVRTIVDGFAANPDAAIVGGRVEADWPEPPPPWLRETGDAPLALLDFGDDPFRITPARPVCLIGANIAVRRQLLERLGGFSTALQRVRDGIGSTEDSDLQVRAIASGASAVYDPRIVVRAQVPRDRLLKPYHRAWHAGHGRFYAIMRDPAFERSRLGTFLGIPAHVYRSLVKETAAWVSSLVARRSATAFAHELRLRFLYGFAVQRIFNRR